MINSYPLHEALKLVVENCWLQINSPKDKTILIPYISGKPGGGKTQGLKYLCSLYYWGLYPEHLAMKPTEELSGMPKDDLFKFKDTEMLATIWTLPDILKDLYVMSEKIESEHKELLENKKIKKENPITIFFLDDFHMLGEDTQPLMFELLTERSIRKYKIPDNVAIVIAGNHGLNKAGAGTLNAAIQNRIMLLPVHTDFINWKNEFAIPSEIHPSIISFLGNPQYNKFFHEEELTDTPWASPRSWSGFSTHLTAKEFWEKNNIKTTDVLFIAQGCVGKEAATHFSEYYSIFSQFDIPSILNAGRKYNLPKEQIKMYALSYALISYFIGYKNKKNIINSISEIIYLISTSSPDLFIMMLNELKSLKNTSQLFGDILVGLKKIDPSITKTLLSEFGAEIN